MSPHPRPTPSPGQTGATLVTSLLILVLLMILGVTALTTSDTQFRLAANVQFEDSAMNNAETAITTAENWLASGGNFRDGGFAIYASATAHLHPIGHLASLAAPANDPLTMVWSDGNSAVVGGNSTQRYLIELVTVNSRLLGSSMALGPRRSAGCNQVDTFLITARGQSARGATKFVQSYYSVLSC